MTARSLTLVAMLVGVALTGLPLWTEHTARFLWNPTASVPVGLYRIEPIKRLEVGDLAVVMPPEPLVTFLAERGYLPRGVPLIKRVLALPGATVCRRGTTIIAYDHAYGDAREHDSLGRTLPIWQGCRTLRSGEVFLMNWDAPDSLDGRYFGPLPASTIIARVTPVWTNEEGDGRFQWASRRFGQEP